MKTILEQQVPKDTIRTYWWISLATGMAVIGVVALLLTVLARTAERIQEVAAQIWQVGQMIANNTIHIPLLVRTNQIIAQVDQATDGIVQATGRIQRAVVNGPGK
jgi:cob(I)alamin adenosyltransferase